MPNLVKTGDCECCTRTDVVVYHLHGMDMCEECKNKQQEAVKHMVDESRKIDIAITLKTDVYLAQTVPAVALRAAIEHDETIPADQKDYTFAKESFTRFQNLQKVIFDKRVELLERENELRMWQTQVQNTTGKLREEERNQFKNLDITYAPTGITKKEKSTKPVKAGTKAFDKNAFNEACKKYNCVEHKVRVRMMMVNKNMSADAAAKMFAEQMGLL